MTDFQALAVEEALRSQLGKTASFWRYDRQNATPMNFVLDEVEKQLGTSFSVYWVDGGGPEVFSLPGFSPGVVVFSRRYLSATAFLRRLIVSAHLLADELLVDTAERVALKVIAEMALRYGDADLAVLALVKSITGKGIFFLADDDQLMALEHEPIHEAYMATWFYGLLHELGHLHPTQKQAFPEEHPFSDAAIFSALTVVLDDNDNDYLPDWLTHEGYKRAKTDARFVLNLDHLRREGLADIFAASLLLKSTFDIMQEIGEKKFEIIQYLSELTVFYNVIWLIDRCRRTALDASATIADPDAQINMAFSIIAIKVRMLMQREYIDNAVARFLTNADPPTPENVQKATSLVNNISKGFADRISKIDRGLASAMEFSLFPDRRENDWELLDIFRQDLANDGSKLKFSEAERFVSLAGDLGIDSKLLRALAGILRDPAQPVYADPTGDIVYFVPWLEGISGFNRPFGLDTKHGHLVFVFRSKDTVYERFFEASAGALKPGFALKHAAVPIPRRERLAPELAAHMPAGASFSIIVEGTEEFTKFMHELSDDTIWSELC